ncbi:MAG: peptidoglycan editing factor PgeF [Thiohalocapsa sp.]|nr:peptidoglycan editing factor PgeF [Thiohalocapsa sp.]MCF7989503.1 peptidoglycan editing factor PgeF [Thiohalocapsa sp.]
MPALDWLEPDWQAPPNVRAAASTRAGGVSSGPFESLNLAAHVGDDPARVAANRARLAATLELPSEPTWLEQVHGCDVHVLEAAAAGGKPARSTEAMPAVADAAVTSTPGRVCAVLTADCLPVLLCDRAGTAVAAVHAGWRGIAGGVIEAAVARIGPPPQELMAWLGPAIGPEAFEVGPDVYDCFCAHSEAAATAFRPGTGDRFFADLYELARQRLAASGILAVAGGRYSTVADTDRFFSFRRDGRTGRMASLIWLDAAGKP